MDWQLTLWFVALAVSAYLLGGIPWALVIGKLFYRIDVREYGSGNLGATNVFRTLGTTAAIGTAVLDISKGAGAVVLAMLVMARYGGVIQEWGMILAAIFAVIGHSYSPYIRFSGGKGVATTAGGLIMLTPWALPVLFVVWLTTILLSRYVSLGSVLAALVYPVVCAVLYPGDWPRLACTAAAAAIIVWRHRSNIGRILKREETKISLKDRGSVVRKRGNS